jgi:hypothetical protein
MSFIENTYTNNIDINHDIEEGELPNEILP